MKNVIEQTTKAEVIYDTDSEIRVFFTFPNKIVEQYILKNYEKYEYLLAEAWDIDELFELIDDRLKQKISRLIRAVAYGDAKSQELAIELIDTLKIRS